MKTIFNLATLAIVASSAVAAQAAPIAWDSFATTAGGNDYELGPIAGQNRSVGLDGFNGAWNEGTNSFVAANGGLRHDLNPGTPQPGHIIAYTSDIGFANRRLK